LYDKYTVYSIFIILFLPFIFYVTNISENDFVDLNYITYKATKIFDFGSIFKQNRSRKFKPAEWGFSPIQFLD